MREIEVAGVEYEFPDNFSDAQILAVLEREGVIPRQPRQALDMDADNIPLQGESARAGLEQGLSLGFIDEAKAFGDTVLNIPNLAKNAWERSKDLITEKDKLTSTLGAIVETGNIFNKDFSEAYTKREDEIRKKYTLARQTNPGNYLSGEIVGGLALPGSLAAKTAAKGWRAMELGAATGFAQGLGYGEEDKAQSAAIGGVIGGAIPFIGGAVNAFGRGARVVSKKAVPELQDDVKAAKEVLDGKMSEMINAGEAVTLASDELKKNRGLVDSLEGLGKYQTSLEDLYTRIGVSKKAKSEAEEVLNTTKENTKKDIKNSITKLSDSNLVSLAGIGLGGLGGLSAGGIGGAFAGGLGGLVFAKFVAQGIAPNIAKAIVEGPQIQNLLTKIANAKGESAQILVKQLEAVITQELTRAGAQ